MVEGLEAVVLERLRHRQVVLLTQLLQLARHARELLVVVAALRHHDELAPAEAQQQRHDVLCDELRLGRGARECRVQALVTDPVVCAFLKQYST